MDIDEDEFLRDMADRGGFDYDFLKAFSDGVARECKESETSLRADWDQELKELMGEGE